MRAQHTLARGLYLAGFEWDSQNGVRQFMFAALELTEHLT